MDKYKYPELTDEIKNQILGLNAAKLFGIDREGEAAGDQGRQAVAAARGVSAEPVAEQHAVRLGVGRGRPRADGAGGERVTGPLQGERRGVSPLVEGSTGGLTPRRSPFFWGADGKEGQFHADDEIHTAQRNRLLPETWALISCMRRLCRMANPPLGWGKPFSRVQGAFLNSVPCGTKWGTSETFVFLPQRKAHGNL